MVKLFEIKSKGQLRSICITANISAGDLLDLSHLLCWKDAEVCEDIKFAFHVFCMTTKAVMTQSEDC